MFAKLTIFKECRRNRVCILASPTNQQEGSNCYTFVGKITTYILHLFHSGIFQVLRKEGSLGKVDFAYPVV